MAKNEEKKVKQKEKTQKKKFLKKWKFNKITNMHEEKEKRKTTEGKKNFTDTGRKKKKKKRNIKVMFEWLPESSCVRRYLVDDALITSKC